jgi:ParB-like chromosome segregation protein Spo0J
MIMVKKKFGAKKTSRAGTGTIDKDTEVSNSEKWTSATASQLDSKVKSTLVKNLPISHIKTDQDNPRKLAIDTNLIREIQSKFSINSHIENEDDNDWIEEYVKKVTNEFNLKGKEIGDFTSIVEFAAVLKSPTRLLHSIVVWQEDSVFHLISGERRLLTHLLLGEEYISSRISEEKLTENEIDLLQWEENIHREDMTLFERTMRVEKLINGSYGISKISVRKLAKVSGLSVSDSQRYLVIIRYPTDTLIKAIETGKIEGLQKAAALAQLSDEDLKAKLSGIVTAKKVVIKPTIKISKNANSDVMKKIIGVITKEFNAESILENLDLSKSKDLNIAFNLLITFLKEKG